jgi:hypothetical protein
MIPGTDSDLDPAGLLAAARTAKAAKATENAPGPSAVVCGAPGVALRGR